MKLNAKMKISNLSLRREKEGQDEGPVAADVKLTCNLSIDAVAGLFAVPSSWAFIAAIYDDNGDMRSNDIDCIHTAAEAIGAGVTLSYGLKSKLEFEHADINKISIKPCPARFVELALRLQLKPTKAQISCLAELLHEEADVAIESRQGDLGLEQPAQAA